MASTVSVVWVVSVSRDAAAPTGDRQGVAAPADMAMVIEEGDFFGLLLMRAPITLYD